MSETPAIAIFTTSEFQKAVRSFAKKYRQIRFDLQPVFDQLQLGEFEGDRLSGIGYDVVKLRIRSSDLQKGKSGGYRLIYWIQSPESIVLVDLYAKSEQEDIEDSRIKRIITKYQQQAQGELEIDSESDSP